MSGSPFLRGGGSFPPGGDGNGSGGAGSSPFPSGGSSGFPGPSQSGGPFSGGSDPFAGSGGRGPEPMGGPGGAGGSGSSPAQPSPGTGGSRPPFGWIGGALVAGLIGCILAAVAGDGLVLPLIGWIVAGPVAIGLVGAYGHFNARAAAKAWYGEPGWCRALYWVALVVIAVAVIGCALRIAFYAGKM